ncbi:hypothetical protein GCM10023340_19720 [Nocardioides marinquilinus]|uniref:HTH luxR-type domain-containing protein n=1 Tax=Nocardioides marinquilinus TaxID=1210400 RepID=A0ABP9PMN4_9ACTN
MTSTPLRITLVDDSDLATAGLRTLLAPYDGRVVVVDTREAIAAPGDLDVVLYEPMGQTSMAASLLRDLQALSGAQAAVFSWAGVDQLPVTPTSPLLPKTLTASQLVVSIERLAEGRFEPTTPPVREPEPAAAESVAPVTVIERPETGLTPRENEIVALIVSGASNREISESLSLSINSVKTYIRSAYRKMGVERRTQAVLWGLAHGMGEEHTTDSLVG